MRTIAETKPIPAGFLTIVTTALGGLVAGVIILVIANVVSATGPSGDGWSFRGNGALVVPFGLGPAVLVGVWTALILRARGHREWRRLGLGAGLVELAIVLQTILVLVLGGSQAGAVASAVGELLQMLWLIAGPLLAAFFLKVTGPPSHSALRHVVAGIVLPFALILGYMLGGLIWRT